MASGRKTKVEKLVGANSWAKWKWQMNMHFEQCDIMSITDGTRKRRRKMTKEICWRGSRIIRGRRRDRECAESSDCGFGIDVQ